MIDYLKEDPHFEAYIGLNGKLIRDLYFLLYRDRGNTVVKRSLEIMINHMIRSYIFLDLIIEYSKYGIKLLLDYFLNFTLKMKNNDT